MTGTKRRLLLRVIIVALVVSLGITLLSVSTAQRSSLGEQEREHSDRTFTKITPEKTASSSSSPLAKATMTRERTMTTSSSSSSTATARASSLFYHGVPPVLAGTFEGQQQQPQKTHFAESRSPLSLPLVLASSNLDDAVQWQRARVAISTYRSRFPAPAAMNNSDRSGSDDACDFPITTLDKAAIILAVQNASQLRHDALSWLRSRTVCVFEVSQGEDDKVKEGEPAAAEPENKKENGSSRRTIRSVLLRALEEQMQATEFDRIKKSAYLRKFFAFFYRYEVFSKLAERWISKEKSKHPFVLYTDTDVAFTDAPTTAGARPHSGRSNGFSLQDVLLLSHSGGDNKFPPLFAAPVEFKGKWVHMSHAHNVDANTGVMVVNLLAFRAVHERFARFTARALAAAWSAIDAATSPSALPSCWGVLDQCPFNHYFSASTLRLPNAYSWRAPLEGPHRSPQILHFQGVKCEDLLCTKASSKAAIGEGSLIALRPCSVERLRETERAIRAVSWARYLTTCYGEQVCLRLFKEHNIAAANSSSSSSSGSLVFGISAAATDGSQKCVICERSPLSMRNKNVVHVPFRNRQQCAQDRFACTAFGKQKCSSSTGEEQRDSGAVAQSSVTSPLRAAKPLQPPVMLDTIQSMMPSGGGRRGDKHHEEEEEACFAPVVAVLDAFRVLLKKGDDEAAVTTTVDTDALFGFLEHLTGAKRNAAVGSTASTASAYVLVLVWAKERKSAALERSVEQAANGTFPIVNILHHSPTQPDEGSSYSSFPMLRGHVLDLLIEKLILDGRGEQQPDGETQKVCPLQRRHNYAYVVDVTRVRIFSSRSGATSGDQHYYYQGLPIPNTMPLPLYFAAVPNGSSSVVDKWGWTFGMTGSNGDESGKLPLPLFSTSLTLVNLFGLASSLTALERFKSIHRWDTFAASEHDELLANVFYSTAVPMLPTAFHPWPSSCARADRQDSSLVYFSVVLLLGNNAMCDSFSSEQRASAHHRSMLHQQRMSSRTQCTKDSFCRVVAKSGGSTAFDRICREK